MLINKYIQEATSETELLSYKLVISSQIIEAQKSLELIAIARRKIELREPNDITGEVWKSTKEDLNLERFKSLKFKQNGL